MIYKDIYIYIKYSTQFSWDAEESGGAAHG